MQILANYYQQFDADYNLDVPGEGYGGWEKAEIEIAPQHTAIVVMHAWHCRSREEYPGWYRAVEYLPRAEQICREVFPPLLSAVREAGWNVFHVVGGGDYFQHRPGYQRAKKLAGAERSWLQVDDDEISKELRKFRSKHTFLGAHNDEDVRRAFANLDFAEEARPHGDEGIAQNADQLYALCKEAGVNHLIYMGFAINYCLVWSPGGMVDMARHGCLCSAFRQAVTAVECKESARREHHKEAALWSVALARGFVFDVDDFLTALRQPTEPCQ